MFASDDESTGGQFARTISILPGGKVNGVRSSHVFDSREVPLKHIYKLMMADDKPARLVKEKPMVTPIKAAVSDAVPVCVLVMGSSGSEKREMFQGSYPGDRITTPAQTETERDAGLAGLIAEDLFTALASDKNTSKESIVADSKCAVTVKFVEFYDELVTDLLRPTTSEDILQREPVVVINDLCQGGSLRSAWAPRVYSAYDVLELIRKGKSRRDERANKKASAECAACYLELELHHLCLVQKDHVHPPLIKPSTVLTKEELSRGWECVAASRLSLVEVPSIHKLAEKELIVREGTTRNRSLLSLATCIKALSQPLSTRGVIPFGNSQLTSLIAEALEGNGFLISLACGSSTDSPKTLSALLSLQQQLREIRQFPISRRRTHVTGLLMRHRAHIAALQEVISSCQQEAQSLRCALNEKSGGFFVSGDAHLSHCERHRALELSLADSKMDAMSAREDGIKMYKVLELLRQKYKNLAEQKANQAKELIATQQAKLNVSKAFLDLQLQMCRARESSEIRGFAAESALASVTQEANYLANQCGMLRAGELRAQNEEDMLAAKLNQSRKVSEKCRVDAVKWREELDALEKLKTLEQARSTEMSAELLKIVAQQDTISHRVNEHGRLTQEVATANADTAAKNDELIQSILSMRHEISELKEKYLRSNAQLEHVQRDAGQVLLDHDYVAADFFANKEKEILNLKRLINEGLSKLRATMKDQERMATKTWSDKRAASRRIKGLKIALERYDVNVLQIKIERDSIADRINAIEASFCARLNRDLAATLVGCPSAGRKNNINPSKSHSIIIATFVSQFVHTRAPLKLDSISLYYQDLVRSYRNTEDSLVSDIKYLKVSEQRATTQSYALYDYCQRLEGVVADLAPLTLEEIHSSACNNGVKAAAFMTSNTDHDNYLRSLTDLRRKIIRQQDLAISAIRSVQIACKEEQDHSAELIREHYELKDRGSHEHKPRARSGRLKVQEPNHVLFARRHTFDDVNKANRRFRTVQEATVSTAVATRCCKSGHYHNRQDTISRAQLSLAHNQVKKVHCQISTTCPEAVLPGESISASKFSSHKKLLMVEDTCTTLLNTLESLSNDPEAAMLLLAHAEKRCIQLNYRVAALEEELMNYQVYMREESCVKTTDTHQQEGENDLPKRTYIKGTGGVV